MKDKKIRRYKEEEEARQIDSVREIQRERVRKREREREKKRKKRERERE